MRFDDAGVEIEVFNNLSFEIESGKSLAIVGESGVGKTTLLNVLGALERPSEGEVYIGKYSLRDLEKRGESLADFRGKNIGFIFQSHNLLPEFSALENVMIPMLIQREDFAKAELRAKELLEKVGLSKRLEHRPFMLSGGEQQRVSVARAFATRPGILLADEPTGNLDIRTGGEVSNLMLEIQRSEGVTLVVVTHSLELAAMMDNTVKLTPQGLIKQTHGE
jgi:lipoprotein-releasing system ATP-binding protein